MCRTHEPAFGPVKDCTQLEPFTRTEAWRVLDLFFKTQEARSRWQLVFYAATTLDLFAGWLADKIYYHTGRTHPIAKWDRGHIFVDHQILARNGEHKIWIHARYEERVEQPKGPALVNVLDLGSIIQFRFRMIAPERIEINAGCLTPSVLNYFKSLLGEMGAAYPETGLSDHFAQYRDRALLLSGRNSNSERDRQIYREFVNGKDQKTLAQTNSLSVARIKQIVKEQKDRNAG